MPMYFIRKKIISSTNQTIQIFAAENQKKKIKKKNYGHRFRKLDQSCLEMKKKSSRP